MPELEAARNELGPAGPELLAISLEDDPPERLRHVADTHGYHGPIAINRTETGLLNPLGVRKVPGMAFVNEDGVVVGATSGVRDRKFILRHARDLVR